MKSLLCIFLLSTSLVMEKWSVDAVPSTAFILRVTRDDGFGEITSEDTSLALRLEPSSHWEDFITPAPMVISLLGELMLISGKVDFSLEASAPKDGGFKYMRHPESFRASLVQVSNDGWAAFMNAHENMDKIQLYMQQIPQQVKTIMKILSQASPHLVESLLPISLTKIQEIGKICVDLSSETHMKFMNVMLLLGELSEVTASSQGQYEQKLEQVQAELNATAMEKAMEEKIGEQLKKRQQEIDAEVKKYQAAYDDAINSIPTGWDAIVQEFGRAVVDWVDFVPKLFNGGGDGGSGGGGGQAGDGDRASPDIAKSQVIVAVNTLFKQIGNIKNKFGQLFGGKSATSMTNVGAFSKVLDTVLNSAESMLKNNPVSDLTSKALGFVAEGRSVGKELESLLNVSMGSTLNETDQQEAMKKFDDLQMKMDQMIQDGAKNAGGVATGAAPPMRQMTGDYSGVGGNERYKADSELIRLRDAEARSDQYFNAMMQYEEQMKEFVGKLARLNLEEINYKDILELLHQGILLLGKIREQWGKLVQFFSIIAVRTQVATNQTMDSFVKYAKKAEDDIGSGHAAKEDRAFFLSLLKDQAEDLNQQAYFVYTLSSTYFDASTRFLMNQLAGLSKLLAIDNSADRAKIKEQLATEATSAQDQIKQMSDQKRQDYKRLVAARKNELEDMLKKLSGPDVKQIQ